MCQLCESNNNQFPTCSECGRLLCLDFTEQNQFQAKPVQLEDGSVLCMNDAGILDDPFTIAPDAADLIEEEGGYIEIEEEFGAVEPEPEDPSELFANHLRQVAEHGIAHLPEEEKKERLLRFDRILKVVPKPEME